MISPKSGRGRPKKKVPFFCDTAAQQERLTGCYKPRRSIRFTEAFIDELSAGGEEVRQELLKDTGPYVNFELVLRLNMSDLRCRPVYSAVAAAKFDAALAMRSSSAAEGGFARQRTSHGADLVAQEEEYIRSKKAEGWNKSRVFEGIKARYRGKRKSAMIGRTEFYRQLNLSGFWD